jgi:hypothetical protein
MTDDAYAVCRHIQHYYSKNGYAPAPEMLHCSIAFLGQLITNGVVEMLPLYESGPLVKVVLTDKGLRMANTERKARQ